MLNPTASNFVIEFGDEFYNENLIIKYNDYLYHKNNPIKNIKDHIHESITNLSIPGLNMAINEVTGLKNFGSPTDSNQVIETYTSIKNQSLTDAFEINKLNLNLNNTLINWSYFYEFFRLSLNRGSGPNKINLENFKITINVKDAGGVPILLFIFNDCFSGSLPPLDFSYNSTIGESKEIDVGFYFNQMDVKLIIPTFGKTNIKL